MNESNDKNEPKLQPNTLADLNAWLKANGMDRPLALINMAQRGEIGLAQAVDPDQGHVFLVAMVPVNLMGSLPHLVHAEIPAGLPADAMIPLPVAQILTAAQSQQVSLVGQSGGLIIFDASIAKADQPAPNEQAPAGQQ